MTPLPCMLETIFEFADSHGDDTGEPDHTVGDLQDILREAWRLLTPAQRQELISSPAVEALFEVQDEELEEALDAVEDQFNGKVRQVTEAGYLVKYRGATAKYYWQQNELVSDDEFEAYHQVIEDAYAALIS